MKRDFNREPSESLDFILSYARQMADKSIEAMTVEDCSMVVRKQIEHLVDSWDMGDTEKDQNLALTQMTCVALSAAMVFLESFVIAYEASEQRLDQIEALKRAFGK